MSKIYYNRKMPHSIQDEYQLNISNQYGLSSILKPVNMIENKRTLAAMS